MLDAPPTAQGTSPARWARPRRQLARLMLLVVHLAVGFAALAADARAEAGPGFSHIEGATDGCAGGHDHASCQFCRLLGSTPDPTTPCDPPHERPSPVLALPPAEDLPAKTAFEPSAGSRAPPLD